MHEVYLHEKSKRQVDLETIGIRGAYITKKKKFHSKTGASVLVNVELRRSLTIHHFYNR
jgi:hypothetical protein